MSCLKTHLGLETTLLPRLPAGALGAEKGELLGNRGPSFREASRTEREVSRRRCKSVDETKIRRFTIFWLESLISS